MASVRRAIVASYFERYAGLLLSLATISITSRILTPAEIGLSVLGATFTALAESMRDFGVTNYIVNSEKLSKDEVRTSFTMMLAVAILITLTLLVSAGWYADFVKEPRITNFVRIVAFGFLFASIGAPIVALLRRDLKFWDIAAINIGSAIVGNGVTVGLALAGVGYMSFAWGSLSWPVSTFFFALLVRRDLSIFRIRFTEWRNILKFGGLNTATGLLTMVGEILPTFALGRMTGSANVAFYNRAQQVCQIPSRLIMSAINAVALPGFAAHARTGVSLKRPYLAAAANLTSVHWPGLVMVALMAHPLVNLMLGDQWAKAIPLVQLMTLSTLMYFPIPLMFPVLVASGGIGDTVKAWIISLPITAAITILAATKGPFVLALSTFLTIPIQVGVGLWFVMRRLELTPLEYLRALAPSALVTAISAVGPLAMLAVNGFDMKISVGAACIGGALGMVLWLVAMGWVRHPFTIELAYLVRKMQGVAPRPTRVLFDVPLRLLRVADE